MRLSFIPADLHVAKDSDGFYLVTLGGRELLRVRSEKAAVAKFMHLRAELESKYPARTLTREEIAETLQSFIANSLVCHNSLGGRKKKTTAGGTRTFGG